MPPLLHAPNLPLQPANLPLQLLEVAPQHADLLEAPPGLRGLHHVLHHETLLLEHHQALAQVLLLVLELADDGAAGLAGRRLGGGFGVVPEVGGGREAGEGRRGGAGAGAGAEERGEGFEGEHVGMEKGRGIGVDGHLEAFLGCVVGAEIAEAFRCRAVFGEAIDQSLSDLARLLNLRMRRRRFIKIDLPILALLRLQRQQRTMERRHELRDAPLKLAQRLVRALVGRFIVQRRREVARGEDGVLAVPAHPHVDTELACAAGCRGVLFLGGSVGCAVGDVEADFR